MGGFENSVFGFFYNENVTVRRGNPLTQFIVDVGCSWNATKTLPLRTLLGLPVLFIDPDGDALDRVPALEGDVKVRGALSTFNGETSFHFYGDGTHSILTINTKDIHKFIGGHTGEPARREDWLPRKSISVPCYRLDTLLQEFNIDEVPFLTIDAQGHDLQVLKSLGNRIRSVWHFELEVQVTDFEIYIGQSALSEVLDYAAQEGFDLFLCQPQTFGQELNLLFSNRSVRNSEAAESVKTILIKEHSRVVGRDQEFWRLRSRLAPAMLKWQKLVQALSGGGNA